MATKRQVENGDVVETDVSGVTVIRTVAAGLIIFGFVAAMALYLHFATVV